MDSSSKEKPEHTKVTTGSSIGRRVRVVAKVRGFTDLEAEFPGGGSTNPLIVVNKTKADDCETVTISFGEQSSCRKESYEVDNCYEQNEDNDTIFRREVKYLIEGVFNGNNATVIANGARGSGKSCVIQGSTEKPGLAALSMAELLLMAEEKGKSVSISLYEVYMDRVNDLLDPKRSAVLVLEDGQGKIQLKGLSRVPVNSISEFYKLYYCESSSRKPAQKMAAEPPRRSHKGLIVHVSSPHDSLDTGRMNFVDLAGYEDARRKSSDGHSLVESSKINKSIYGLLNVVKALNASEGHVPYRESKITRMLQDSLGVPGRILMVTCLNPSLCQDSIYMLSLASRCCQGTSKTVLDSIKKSKGLTRLLAVPSPKNPIPRTVSASAKKQTISRAHLSERKPIVNKAAAVKGRKLFGEASDMGKLEKENCECNVVKAAELTSVLQKDIADDIQELAEHGPPSINISIKEQCAIVKGQNKDEKNQNLQETIEDYLEDVTPAVKSNTKELVSMDDLNTTMGSNVNNMSQTNEDRSPPISVRLRDLSNSLKSISATPLDIEIPDEIGASSSALVAVDIMEPQTPTMEQSTRVNDRWEIANLNSPWGNFSICSSEVKNSLVDEYLRLLNTASKEELKRLRGIGEKRANYIIELREESPQPFKSVDDLKEIGLSAKQVKGMMKKEVGNLFN